VGSSSQEAFIGLILATVLGMSFLTKGLGLSNTLGSFVLGMILAMLRHREKIEAELSPFQGILVELFLISVGVEINLVLIASKSCLLLLIVLGVMALKGTIITCLC
jgi:CPA2 family monovalent cation:H+ antiporter-2